MASGGLAGIGRAYKSIAPTPFKTLPYKLQRKFRTAGLRNGSGHRTFAEAEQFYRSRVPRQVRQFGPEAIRYYLKDKHASHIKSVRNAPGKERVPRNILWEPPQWNLRRGQANMKSWEKMRTHAKNGADATGIVGKNALVNARSGTIWGALMEAPVSAVEGAICVAKGKMSKEDAAKKAVINTAKSSAVAGFTAIGFTVVAALGAGPVLATASPVLILTGGAIYSVSTVKRIQAAMNNPNPLPRVPFYFHTGCSDCGNGLNCFEEFAAEMSRPA